MKLLSTTLEFLRCPDCRQPLRGDGGNGVLHHTPDCHAAFAALPRLLRPGGEIAIWLYNAYADNLNVNAAYRRVAQKLPKQVLYGLCHLAVPGYCVFKVPVLRSVLHH